MFASAFAGQSAVSKLPSPPCKDSERTTFETYVPPACLRASKNDVNSKKLDFGIEVMKVTTQGRFQCRRLAIADNNRTVLVTSHRPHSVTDIFKSRSPVDNSRRIDISCIDRLQVGQQTKKFVMARAQKSGPMAQPMASTNSLSIVYRPTPGSTSVSFFGGATEEAFEQGQDMLETLDLVIPSFQDFKELTKTLGDLVALYKVFRSDTHRDVLLLQHHWIELGKGLDKPITVNDWVEICEEGLNLPFRKKNVMTLFRRHAKIAGASPDGLHLSQAVGLLSTTRETARIQSGGLIDPGEAVWAELLRLDEKRDYEITEAPSLYRVLSSGDDADDYEVGGGEEVIAADQFLGFLQEVQGQKDATIVQVHDLFARLNSQAKVSAGSALLCRNDSDGTVDGNTEVQMEMVKKTKVPQNRIAKSTFLHYILSDANDVFDPKAGASGQMDMTHPLSSYWVSTGHDTYLTKSGPDSMGRYVADVDMYASALRRGCRCLELDVWGVDEEPMVALSSGAKCDGIPFGDVLRVVCAFLHAHPSSYPVILCIEDHCTVKVQEKMAKQLYNILGKAGMLYEPADGIYGGPEEDDILPSPHELRGKVVIKSKRSVGDKENPTVVLDDFDEDNDFDPHKIERKASDDFSLIEDVMSLDGAGSFVSDGPSTDVTTPQEKLDAAVKSAEEAKAEAKRTETRAFRLQVKANRAEEQATTLLTKLGIRPEEMEDRKRQLEIAESLSLEQGQQQGGNLERVRMSFTEGEVTGNEASPGAMNANSAGVTNDLGEVVASGTQESDPEATILSTTMTVDDGQNTTLLATVTEGDENPMLDKSLNFLDAFLGVGDNKGHVTRGATTNEEDEGSTYSEGETHMDTSEDDQASTEESQVRVQSLASVAEDDVDEEGLEVELLVVSKSEENVPVPMPTSEPRIAAVKPKPSTPPKKEEPVKMKKEEEEIPVEIHNESATQGLEVQHFFAESVNNAKLRHAEAVEAATLASKAADKAAAEYRRSSAALANAEDILYNVIQREKDLSNDADRAAAEARSNREHADIAQERVGTVKELLSKCEDQAATSETVAVTAVTEANISEERASDAERRAKRAQANAARDRKKADEATKKEEELDRDLAKLQRQCSEAVNKARDSKEETDRATAALERIGDQIKILESSAQFRRELAEAEQEENESNGDGGSSVPRPLLSKHKEKQEERRMYLEKTKELSAESYAREVSRRTLEEKLHDMKHRAKAQAKQASSARRQADQSTSVAEQLTEYAEEEREAAQMRSYACAKAKERVEKSKEHCASIKAQLEEAQRAAYEAADLADESRDRAESLAAQALEAKNITFEQRDVEECKMVKEKAEIVVESATAVKVTADAKAAEAKKHLDTAYEVFYQAKRISTAEIHRINAERQVERNAIQSHENAVALRAEAEQAKTDAAVAVKVAAEKVAAAKLARDYRDKKSKVQPISANLVNFTLLHSTKFRYWEKSVALPASYMHSISEGEMHHMVERGPALWEQWIEFNRNHMCRVFPSRHDHMRTKANNLNPVLAWAMGCQMVSMNFQSCDDHLLLNDGRFRMNASSGYVLKPEHLTDGRRGHDMEDLALIDYPKNIAITVLGGYNLPKPCVRKGRDGPISPRVRIAMFDGTPESATVPQVHVTEVVKKNGINPIWDSKNKAQFVAESPNIAMILITLWDSSDDGGSSRDDFIAAAAIPVSCVRQGYRSVPLFDLNHTRRGAHAFASLLLKVEVGR